MSAEAARSVMDHARMEVMEGKEEMQKIKADLRSVAAGGDKTLNCLWLSTTKVTGLPESAMPRFKLQIVPDRVTGTDENMGSPELRR